MKKRIKRVMPKYYCLCEADCIHKGAGIYIGDSKRLICKNNNKTCTCGYRRKI